MIGVDNVLEVVARMVKAAGIGPDRNKSRSVQGMVSGVITLRLYGEE
jgi:hypothetical protein